MKQEIQFCTARDDVRIAYATAGNGPPLVKAANYLTHLEHDWNGPSGCTVLPSITRLCAMTNAAAAFPIGTWRITPLSPG